MDIKEWLSRAQGISGRIAASAAAGMDTQALKQIRAEIMGVISRVDNHVLATLLIERYVNNKPWKKVALIIHYSQAYTQKTLHPKALQAAKQALDNRERSPCGREPDVEEC